MPITLSNPNEMSCVLEVRNKETSFWLISDVERGAEGKIIECLIQISW